jgi:tetratricopeptide (TPR) repeat protein
MRPLFIFALACTAPGLGYESHAQTLPPAAVMRQALMHYFDGQAHLGAERWDRASREFAAAIKLHPLLTDAHYGLGQAYMGLERYTSAALAFQECLAAARTIHGLRSSARVTADHEMLDLVDEIRDTIRRRGPDTLRARQLDAYVARLLATRPSLGSAFEPPPPVMLALGSAHFRAGNRGRAEYYWKEAARLDASLGEAWNNLAAIYAAAERRREAEDAVRNAERAGFRVNPRLKDAIGNLKPGPGT